MIHKSGSEETVGIYLEKELDKEWKKFHQTLADFPHSFQLEDQEHLSKTRLSKLLPVIQGELQAGLHTSLEVARSLNLLGYTLFQLCKPQEALQRIEEALTEDGEEQNLVSLANKAVILWHRGAREQAKIHVKALEELKKNSRFSYLTVRAKAELAFSYSRLGGHFGSKAVLLFDAVIKEAREPEIWLFKFGLALSERRMVNFNSSPVLADASEDKKLMNTLHILQEIINNCQSKNLKAKCYSEIAHLLANRREGKSQKIFEDEARLTAVKAREKALDLDPDDCSVLWKCGKIFRYAKRLDKSVELLEKSVKLKPTTAGYHHLGLSLKASAKKAILTKRNVWTDRGRGRSKSSRNMFRCGHGSRRKQGGRCWSDSGREFGSFFSGGEGTRESRQAESFSIVQSKNRRGWNANQGGLAYSHQERWTKSHARNCTRGANRSWPRHNLGSYSQLCLRGSERSAGYREKDREQPDMTKRYFENSVSRYGASNLDEMVDRDTDMPDDTTAAATSEQFLSAFSKLSLSASSTPMETKAVANDSQKSHIKVSSPRSPDKPCDETSDETLSAVQQRTIQSLRQVVKSPSKDIQFSRNDEFVLQAMNAFQKAVDISKGENVRAVYDLALMHKQLGEFQKALHVLENIQLAKQTSLGPFEQAGLILKDMSEMESDVDKRKRLNEEGEFKLNMALRLCSRLCNRMPRLKQFIEHVWHAFPTLLIAAEKSDRDITEKMYEKAKLFQMIRDNQQSMALLQEIRNINPKEADNPAYVKMHIENYVELECYDKALALIETYKCTTEGSSMYSFDDKYYLQKVYMKAAKAALLNSTFQDAVKCTATYFADVFADIFKDKADEISSSDDADSIEEAGGDDSWDILLLHEASADAKAEVLISIFEDVCGLRVTNMNKDCLPGRFKLESILSVMSKTKQIVVLAGERPLSSTLRLLLEKAAKRLTTVALLVDGEHVPKVLSVDDRSQKRHMVCPKELLNENSNASPEARWSQSKVNALCEVFSFLVGILD